MQFLRHWLVIAIGCLAPCACDGRESAAAAPLEQAPQREGIAGGSLSTVAGVEALPWTGNPLLQRVSESFTGDFDAVRARGVLRVLVSYSRTNFFLAEGRLRGFEYEMFHELQKQLAAEETGDRPPLQIAFIPLPFEQLLPALVAGHGDVAAASLTVTPDRQRMVAFTEPYQTCVDQVLVSHVGLPAVHDWSDLAGQQIHVVAGSSFVDQLESLNAELVAAGKEPLTIVPAARGLHAEDLLELVHSGAYGYTVADGFLAELWSSVLDGIRLEHEVVLGTGAELAWAVRPENSQLKAKLDGFIRANKRGSLIGNVLFKRYYGAEQWIANPLLEVERSKLGPFLEPLQRHAAEFGFDWRLIAAQAFQESRLDPQCVSSAGAIGLMQLLPSTAAEMGVYEPTDPERNLYAGIKYLGWLRRRFFDEPQLSAEVQLDFCLAAYNAGPSRVKRWRAAAPGRGLDPDRWFGHVELLALEDLGVEPVRYVGNINKYYVLFTLSLESLELTRAAREATSEATAR